jgi:hypothetical protein
MKNITKFICFDNDEIVFFDITDDLERREQELRNQGMVFDRIEPKGVTSELLAKVWLRFSLITYQVEHHLRRPRYNQ